MDIISGSNVPEAYIDGLWKLRVCAKPEESRNGPVLVMPRPTLLIIHNPWERVLIDDVRQPNPYFHLAEFVWMMAGSNDAKWISDFNSNMMSYSDDGEVFKAAYGHRWRRHFTRDQIREVIDLLRKDPTTRRAVISMWDPNVDLEQSKDIPCNTTIYFRVNSGFLDMTVCNRSNDFVWGMLGANAVHMTSLQEFVALAVGAGIGKYYVFTNNLHIYKSVPRYEEIMGTLTTNDVYRAWPSRVPLLTKHEDPIEFFDDCARFLEHKWDNFSTVWFNAVFIPMMKAYRDRKKGEDEIPHLSDVMALDWRMAGLAWRKWKNEQSSSR